MLLSFTVTNFKSIKDAQTLRLTSEGNNKIHSSNIAFPDKNKKIAALRTIAIYGANASGKSNVIQALDVLRDLVLLSRQFGKGAPIRLYNPFRLSEETKTKPTEFELEFIACDSLRYIYCVKFDKIKIIEESLHYYPNGKKALLFWRDDKDLKLGSSLLVSKNTIAFNENQCYISVLGNMDECNERIKHASFFLKRTNIFDHRSRALPRGAVLKEDKVRSSLATLMTCADTGITSIGVKENIFNEEEFLKDLPTEWPEEVKQIGLENKKYEPIFYHNKTQEEFLWKDESYGTRRLFDIAMPILKTLILGQVLIIDEIDSQLHPKVVRMIIELFNNDEFSERPAQLIFTTHNTNLMDQNLFRRDQIFFTQKKKSGKTELYSLADFNDVRATTVFEKWYNDGTFDAIPRISILGVKDMLLELRDSQRDEGEHEKK